jgi:4-amino-4-deoxy-L-arabinose transferase-like glycosyltransferase
MVMLYCLHQFMKIASRPQLALCMAWVLALTLNLASAVLRPGGSPDTERYDRIGWNLAQGHGYTASAAPPYQPDIFRAPGYPAFLALVYRFAGHDLTAVRVVQAVLLSFLVPLTYFLAHRCFDPPTARLSVFLAALYPYYWTYAGSALSDGLAVLLTAAMMALLVLSLERPLGWALLAGIGLGLLCLFKPAMLLFPVFAAAIYALQRRPWAGRATVYLVGAMLVVCPWTARNFAVTGQVVPLAAGGGLMLYAGVAGAAYGYDLNEFHQRVELGDKRLQDEQHEEDPARVLALDESMKADALRLIRGYPLAYARHLAVSTVRVWISAWVWRGDRWALSWPHALLSGGLLAAALGGIAARRRQWREALVLVAVVVYVSLVHAPFACEARQSLPGRICLIIFAAALLVATVRRVRPQAAAAEAAPPEPSPAHSAGAAASSCYTGAAMGAGPANRSEAAIPTTREEPAQR